MIEQSTARTGSPQRRPLLDRVRSWLQSRGVDVAALTDTALQVDIPAGVRTYFLGGMTLFFLLVQVITGILLTLYYLPSAETAYQSVLYIMNEVRFGWLIRSIHAWGANLMILACVLHLLRVYFQGAYKKPREITWTVGVFLLLLTMAFGFTGYLLPWDQRAFWATTVGTEIAGAVPGIGDLTLRFLRAGETVSGQTLARFYSIHTLVLPLGIALLVSIHLWLIHQQGLAAPPGSEDEEIRS
jgi:quinol-cytochrome oxidoreductase complex cytochrome b subunit